MNTPIWNFMSEYAASSPVRFHMPGHKGLGPVGVEKIDITEIDGADRLFCPDGIIAESERNAGELFGAHTFYSAGGSTACIQTMLLLIARYAACRGEKAKILAGRNAHKSFINAAALLDIQVEWLWGDDTYLSCAITAEQLESRLAAEKFTAVYITSPDYLGNTVNLSSLSGVCHSSNVILAVDNAHGAYLKFLPESRHPMDLGVDICCDSAHKTLPVLTGGAYLHISPSAPPSLHCDAKAAMSVFASSSPSYLILASLDLFNSRAADFKQSLDEFLPKTDFCKERLANFGFDLVGDEPLKITVKAKSYGYTGIEMDEYLRECNIHSEFSDKDYIVFMLSPSNSDNDLEKLINALKNLNRRPTITEKAPTISVCEAAVSPKEAMLSKSEILPAEDCVGKIFAAATVSCPPAIPVLIWGERISRQSVGTMEYYEITQCRVIKE